ncbi:hypothetical protein [Mycobacterium sp. DL592]|uniref:hypothetical protein n=1 Tax=Mycobacterium sp. DL592 TaxID=2675524 RepID=UPI0014239F96|nr:hypothetical protein [Mycobacterium sp. DL592]
MVRWLQLGAAATGVGIALAAAPGTALADDGTDAHSAPSAGHHKPRSAADKPSSARPAAATRSGSVSTVSAARVTARPVASTVGSAKPQQSSAVSAPLTTTSSPTLPDAVNGLLYSVANLLSVLPQGPITYVAESALFLVRRTLFPASVGVITAPITVPLYFTPIDSDGDGIADTKKLGIYATLGNGAKPKLFEFDTGASGFFAAYASNDPHTSDWWGNGVKGSTTLVSRGDDSGITYSGVAANTTVSLFTQGNSLPLASTGSVQVGQANLINSGSTNLWTPSGTTISGGIDPPPIEKAFYGDFGVGTNYEADGITSLLSQFTFGNGISPGFIVHVDDQTQQAWVQIGLTAADLHNPSTSFFAMDPDESANGNTVPNSGVQFYKQQLIKAKINISDGSKPVVTDSKVKVVLDTGAVTTLHNTDKSSEAAEYDKILVPSNDDPKKGVLAGDLTFSLKGTTVGGQDETFFTVTTTTDHQQESLTTQVIKFQNEKAADGVDSDKSKYYLNSGIQLFYHYDVVYDLGNSAGGGQLGLTAQTA